MRPFHFSARNTTTSAIVAVAVAPLALTACAAFSRSGAALPESANDSTDGDTIAPDDVQAPGELPALPVLVDVGVPASEDGADPFDGVSFVMDADLPAAPQTLLVAWHNFPPIGEADARHIADQLGFDGPLYVQEQPEQETALPIFIAFEGSRRLTMHGNGVTYEDWGVHLDYGDLLPAEQAAPLAESLLQERGLLDFDYELREQPIGDIGVYRRWNGIPIDLAEIAFVADAGGEIGFVSYPSSFVEDTLGEYPVRSVETAWQMIQEGVVHNDIPYYFLPSDEELRPPPSDISVTGPLFWLAPYEAGQEVHRYGYATVYRVLDDPDTVRIQLENDLRLEADSATLRAISEHPFQLLHIWGSVSAADGIKALNVSGWEVAEGNEMLFLEGNILRAGELVSLATGDGQTFVLPNVPSDLPDGARVSVNAWASRVDGDTQPVLDWGHIGRLPDNPEEAVAGSTPFGHEGMPPNVGAEVTIHEVQLVYYPVYKAGVDQYVLQIALVPVWKFTGQTDFGDGIEFMVPAVTEVPN